MNDAIARYALLSGYGYPASEDAIDDAVASLVANGGRLVHERRNTSDVSVVEVEGKTLAIGGDAAARNAWIVDITA